jgi:MFS family permease
MPDSGLNFRRARAVALVSAGNFLEMYDFMVFGYYATSIAKAFFPLQSQFASLMLTLMTFGAGFLMRPIGALVFGAYIDRHGRRKGLMLTLSLMAIGTVAIALVPNYSVLGLAAPILILLARLIQGLSAGAELGGVSVYLSEIAPPNRRGFYVAWQSGSQQVAVAFAASLGIALSVFLKPPEIQAWGWRIPFIIGCALIPLLIIARSRLEETEVFKARSERLSLGEAVRSVWDNAGLVFRGMMLAAMTTIFFYMITAYTPTYGSAVLHFSAKDSMVVTLIVGATNFTLLPIMGAVSDRIGRAPLLIGASSIAVLSGYPAMRWLISDPTFHRLIFVEMYFAIIYATYNSAMVVFLTEVMPLNVRTSGFALSYSLATAVLGGFTPALATFLIQMSGDRAIPGAWLSLGALMSLVSAITFFRRQSGSSSVLAPFENGSGHETTANHGAGAGFAKK